MRRALVWGALATLALAIPGVAGAGDEPNPGRVQVRGSEFDLVLSKQKVKPGRVIVQFLNAGEDPHDLHLQRAGDATAPEYAIGKLEAGEYENLDLYLKKHASYVLWCSLPDHRALGMEATLRTRKHRRR